MRKDEITGCSRDGTAPHLGCGDRGFESLHSDQNVRINKVFGSGGRNHHESYRNRREKRSTDQETDVYVPVAEQADAPSSKVGAGRREGSIPSGDTKTRKKTCG